MAFNEALKYAQLKDKTFAIYGRLKASLKIRENPIQPVAKASSIADIV